MEGMAALVRMARTDRKASQGKRAPQETKVARAKEVHKESPARKELKATSGKEESKVIRVVREKREKGANREKMATAVLGAKWGSKVLPERMAFGDTRASPARRPPPG